VIELPPAPPRLAMLAHVMAGHLFAYHAARAIDEGARFFSRVRAAVVAESAGAAGMPCASSAAEEGALEAGSRLRAGRFESALGPGKAADLLLLLHGAAGRIPRDALPESAAGDGVCGALIAALTDAVRELERPVDAIRHQAKIVTVGTSRSTEKPEGPVFDALDEAGVNIDAVPDLSLAALRAVQAALDEIEGWARYRVEGLAEDGSPTDDTRHFIEKRGGVSAKLASRAEGGAPLKGTKRGVVAQRRHFVGIGAKDGRSLVIVPLLDARVHCTALVLLHVKFRETMPVEGKVAVLGHRRLDEIVDGVTEADVPWTDSLLDPVPPKHLVAFSTEKVIEEIVARARGKS